ncbi:unnamed protein product [Fusarium graminearum]|uniref:Chromosome 3, complete genome n=1 Tax=Gibberella zeae (strain ATCC MYA-4620 / CBS 123657 / FGSC 9075 / NRRL 31084 / PH-1) TaxID=229533 RepID=A0A0E0SJI5_GIBZE|nr:hypothetical protein FG05_30327 [Fusarium graminearum]CAF3472800.1 unnamed protein product [Fusarium graminearum]CAF3538526.1 unnamed protein product [Fusarium graminearum]CEF86598.1 unnamed protein product [Fusarium graminearum]
MKFSIAALSLVTLAAASPVQERTNYISYEGLKRDGTPCSLVTVSWQNCRPAAYANTWSRGCSPITRCRDGYPPGP